MTGFLSYNSILNYEPRKREDPTCVGCSNYTPIGGGDRGVLSQCLAGQVLWTAKTCTKYKPKEK